MAKKKKIHFCKGDIIRTNPENGFYGVAVVLNDGVKLELSPGRFSYPMCHIAITPLLFNYKIDMNDIDINELKPMLFTTYFKNNETFIPWKSKICIDIYTTRNKADLPIIGNVDMILIWDKPLSFEASPDGFHLCGDVSQSLGIEAYIQWCRENDIDYRKNND